MINTYHSSVAPPPVPPPPVPPRLHGSRQGAHPILVPTPMLPQTTNRTFMLFLVGVVLLNILMSVLGFFYLLTNRTTEQQGMLTSTDGASPQMQKQDRYHTTKKASHRAFARMAPLQPQNRLQAQSGLLTWDFKHSPYSHPHINYFNSSWLTIEEPGDYLVYSRVTFSKNHPTAPLINQVMLRKNAKDSGAGVMKAYCSTSSSLCTATVEDVITLEKGNQLSVWTEDISLVNYDRKATAFGLYKMW